MYDFHGRVTRQSIKNMQLIPTTSQETVQQFTMQMGKRDNDEFVMDVQFPLSILTAFGLAVAALDFE